MIAGGDGAEAQAGAVPPKAQTPAPAASKKPADEGGSTLFERMANLSRGGSSKDDDDDDDDEDGGSLNIPRFLGRQNNQ